MDIYQFLSNINFSSVLWQILTPIIFSLADIVTGFIQAIINKNVDSSIMRKGLLHKVLLIIIIILSFLLDITFSLGYISKLVCGYIIIMELVSIAENITKAGIDIGKLKDILNLKKGDEE